MSDLEDFESRIEDLMEMEMFWDELGKIGSENCGCNLCDTDPQKKRLKQNDECGSDNEG